MVQKKSVVDFEKLRKTYNIFEKLRNAYNIFEKLRKAYNIFYFYPMARVLSQVTVKPCTL